MSNDNIDPDNADNDNDYVNAEPKHKSQHQQFKDFLSAELRKYLSLAKAGNFIEIYNDERDVHVSLAVWRWPNDCRNITPNLLI